MSERLQTVSARSISEIRSLTSSRPIEKRDHTVGDTEAGAHFISDTLVRRRRRMGDQALRVAEIIGNICQFERGHEMECHFPTAVELERHDGPAVSHLFLANAWPG